MSGLSAFELQRVRPQKRPLCLGGLGQLIVREIRSLAVYVYSCFNSFFNRNFQKFKMVQGSDVSIMQVRHLSVHGESVFRYLLPFPFLLSSCSNFCFLVSKS